MRELRVDRYELGAPKPTAFAIDLPADGILHYGMDRNSQLPFDTQRHVDFKKLREFLDFTHRVSKGAPRSIALEHAPPMRARANERRAAATASRPPRLVGVWVTANIVLLGIIVALFLRWNMGDAKTSLLVCPRKWCLNASAALNASLSNSGPRTHPSIGLRIAARAAEDTRWCHRVELSSETA